MYRIRVTILMLGLLMFSGLLVDAEAQKGVYIGANFGADRLTYDTADSTLAGPNYEIDFGYNFTDLFGLFFTVGGASFDGGTARLGFIDFGPRLILWKGTKFQPYLDAMATVATIDNGAFDFSYNGFGGTATVGAHYFISYSIAINASASVTRINFSDVKFAGFDVDGLETLATNTRFKVGMAFYFR